MLFCLACRRHRLANLTQSRRRKSKSRAERRTYHCVKDSWYLHQNQFPHASGSRDPYWRDSLQTTDKTWGYRRLFTLPGTYCFMLQTRTIKPGLPLKDSCYLCLLEVLILSNWLHINQWESYRKLHRGGHMCVYRRPDTCHGEILLCSGRSAYTMNAEIIIWNGRSWRYRWTFLFVAWIASS